MKFLLKRKKYPFEHKYPRDQIDTARKFAKVVYKELGDFVVALTLFGSAARRDKRARDIDVMIIIDDVHVNLTRELVETYRIIIAKAVSKIDPKRLHVQTVKWSTFWEYVRVGDPVAINILRDSIALIDIGFFDPLQGLLFSGRIRPTGESVWTYYSMAPASINKSNVHIDLAIVDLYWAVIDASHAALMSIGEIPPSPNHVADMLQEKLVKTKKLDARYVTILKHIYEVAKRIMHRDDHNFDGKDYDKYRRFADEFVRKMRIFIEKQELR